MFDIYFHPFFASHLLETHLSPISTYLYFTPLPLSILTFILCVISLSVYVRESVLRKFENQMLDVNIFYKG